MRQYDSGRDLGVKPGDIVFSTPILEGDEPFFCDVDVARRLAPFAGFDFKVKHLVYRPEPIARAEGGHREAALRVLAIQEVPVAQHTVCVTETDPAVLAAMKLERGVRRRRAASKAKARAGPKAKVGPKRKKALESSGSEDAAAPGASSGESTADELLGPEERADWREAAVASAPSDGVEEPPPPAAPDVPPPPGLEMTADGSVVLDGRVLGKVNEFWSNPLRPALYAYCRKHQCCKWASNAKNPSSQRAMRWIEWGHSTECSSKEAHLAAFDKIVYRPFS